MTIRFAAVGFQHNHIYNQVNMLLEAGAELIWSYEEDAERRALFAARYPQAQAARSLDEILEDQSIHLITSAVIPNQRAALGVRVMLHGKDYLCAKPGFTSLEQLHKVHQVQAQTARIYAVHFGERFGSPATIKAAELVQNGAIGRVVQTIGFGPHRLLGHGDRPEWAYDKQYFGGILNDLASHQIDQFLFFTGSDSAQIISAQVANFKHPQFPHVEDFGDLTLRSDDATGYIRVDWMTPPGLPTWGDVRLFLLGTEGTIELRKTCDLAGRPGKDHLFLVDAQDTHYIDCSNVAMPYGAQLITDILNRTETAMQQAHCFLASELALIAQAQAVRL